MHSLFKKQLHETTRPDGSVDLDRLSDLVSSAYDENDRERRRTERSIASMIAELETTHDRLVQALEVIPEGIVIFDAEDRYVLWNERYAELYAESRDLISVGARFEDVLRAGLARGQYPTAAGSEEEWLRNRLVQHRLANAHHEQSISGGRWLRIDERRTPEGGSVGIRVDITELKQREQSAQRLFDCSPLPMWICDRETVRFLAVNDAALAMYGYSREQFLSMTLFDIREPKEYEALATVLQGHLEPSSALTFRHRKSDGSEIDVDVYAQEQTHDGRPAVFAIIIDVTARKHTERELLRTREFLNTIVENIPLGVFVKDAKTLRYVLVNRASEEYSGLNRNKLIGKAPHDIYPADIADAVVGQDRLVIDNRQSLLVEQHSMGAPRNGKKRLLNTRKLLLSDFQGDPEYLVGVVEDITERQAAQAEIAHLAHHDSLTGLSNRAAFNNELDRRLRNARAGNGTQAVLSLDIDRFKDVNDIFGHQVGDELMRAVAGRLSAASGGAFVARFGGDEFIMLPPPDLARDQIAGMCDRLIRDVTNEFAIRDYSLHVGLSIGVAMFPADGADASSLLANADAALYRAKADGKGVTRYFEPQMDHELREKRVLQCELVDALRDDKLEIHYQPQASIEGTVLGFEALLRWQHPSRGYISPSVFIPLAEQAGSIVTLGEWVLRRACREAASWRAPLQIAVNLSPVQFQGGDLVSTVHSVLLETGLAPSRLELEITEGVLIGDFARALSILRRLKALGVRIAMDDFGTGYSSLSYIQSFPFDKIKVDRQFIANLGRLPKSGEIVRAVLGLAQALDIPVTAEGVETTAQQKFLARLGCQQIQGYLIGRPCPIHHYRALTGGAVADSMRTDRVGAA